MNILVLLLLVAVDFALTEEHKCPANSYYDECGTACPVTCDNYKDPSDLCIKICNPGCHCDEGYVRIKEDIEECLKPEECPAPPDEGNCVDEPDTGMCRGYFPMWYFDEDAVECKQFIYGGCDGNGNRYATKEECLRKCAHIWESDSDRCSQPAETGLCRGYFPRYYFDKSESQCKMFIYGGCRGNDNNFKTIEECERVCRNREPLRARNACEEDKEVGPCKAAFERFYFNKNTGRCEPFIYGGCDGNSNNFLSTEDCEAVCIS